MNRQALKAQRLALTETFQVQSAKAVAKKVIQEAFFQEAEHIAFYLPIHAELDPRPILKAAEALGKHCYLPVIEPDKPNHLAFMPFKSGTVLVNNRFGIPEPVINPALICSAQALDLVFTPLLAFDAQGHRLGMGGGFYDRTFAFLKLISRPAKPLLCGLAYDCQELDQINPQPWDVCLDFVISPRF